MIGAAEPVPGCGPFVAVVGNLNVDVKTSPVAASGDLFKDGETSVERIVESIGGGGANTAAAAALLGGKAVLCAAVGDDELGRRLVSFLRGIGVDVRIGLKQAATGISMALNWTNGCRHFVSSLPNTRLLVRSDIDLKALAREGCGQLYRADVWFSEPMLSGGNETLFRDARDLGMETSLDINWDPLWNCGTLQGLVESRIASVRKLLPLVNFIHGNEEELMRFTGTRDPHLAVESILDGGAVAVVLHRGAKGSAVRTKRESIEVPAVSIGEPLSPSGSGDVFTAAFLLGTGLPFRERLAAGNAAAAAHINRNPSYIPELR